MAKVAEEWLNICGGCEVAILDLGEKLLDLLPSLEFVHMPVLMDHKYFGQVGEKNEMEIPEADVGIDSLVRCHGAAAHAPPARAGAVIALEPGPRRLTLHPLAPESGQAALRFELPPPG